MELESTLPFEPGDASAPGGQVGRYQIRDLLGRGGMGVVLRAHDPELSRDIALKVLAGDGPDEDLAAEAQAMARLSHPNVVTVYEVGQAAGQRFIAMELVAGQTLRAWMKARRPWREVTAMFVAAGRGLVAAHDAGLVHRDFKPENVLVGGDGRPRVSDFGLVSRPVGPLALGTAGTPAYMAPEQWRGEEVDARADQFAFVVALWEALWGTRPFHGESAEALRAAVEAGKVVAPTERRGVPRRVEAALRRALAPDRAARWPTLVALLAELERATGRRRTLVLVGLTVGGLAAGALAARMLLQAPAAPRCPEPGGGAVWGPLRRARVSTALAAADPALGPARLVAVGARFDSGLGAWRAASVAACRANRIEGRDSDTLHDQRVRCLDGWLDELGQTVDLVERAAEPAAVDRAVQAAAQLSSVERCSDVATLGRAQVPPPAHRAEVEALTGEVITARVARRAGGPEAREADAARVARARAIGHPPTLALTLEELALAQLEADDATQARATLEELARVAAEAGDDRLTALAWVESVRVLRMLKKPDEARQILPVAHAAVVRAGGELSLATALAVYEATLIGATGESAKALAVLDEAQRALAAAPGSHDDEVVALAMTRGIALANAKRFDDAAAAFRAAIAAATAALGADHPKLIGAYMNLAEAARRGGHLDDSAAALEAAARIAGSRGEQTKALARIWARLAGVELQRDRPVEALARYDQAIALAERIAPDDDALWVDVASDRGFALRGLGRPEEAIAAYDQVIARAERAGLHGPTDYQRVYNRACARRDAGDLPGALADYQASLAAIEAKPPDFHVHVVPSLVGIGDVLVRMGRPAEAIAPLERALAMKVPPVDAGPQPVGRYFLARALAESKRDVARAVVEARAARAEIAAGGDDEWLPVVDAFLAGGGRVPGGVAPPPPRR